MPPLVWPRQSFPDQDLANVPAIDFDMRKSAPEFICPAAFDDADLTGREQLFQPFLRLHAEGEFFGAFGEVDFGSVEAHEAIFDAKGRMDRIAVNDVVCARPLSAGSRREGSDVRQVGPGQPIIGENADCEIWYADCRTDITERRHRIEDIQVDGRTDAARIAGSGVAMARQEQINQLVASEDVAYDEAMERRTDAEWALRLKMESIAGGGIHDAIPDALSRRKWQALLDDDEGDLAELHSAYRKAQVAEDRAKRAYETALERAYDEVRPGSCP